MRDKGRRGLANRIENGRLSAGETSGGYRLRSRYSFKRYQNSWQAILYNYQKIINVSWNMTMIHDFSHSFLPCFVAIGIALIQMRLLERSCSNSTKIFNCSNSHHLCPQTRPIVQKCVVWYLAILEWKLQAHSVCVTRILRYMPILGYACCVDGDD
jgi:hypothetical protein